ncbi:MAG TPA: BlaI/MecI/CopY family transcriptional regulator, partial [Acidobacteriota bacterium]|nr:BlaI/MecI/CopY family transcriptional regulator [Acidobacteriota bacterium]
MIRKKNIKLTKFELEIMEALWKLGRASVREMQEILPEHKRAAYTTIQTIIHRLELKSAVRQVRKIGNAYIYEPAISRESAHRRLVDEFLDIFGGSARPLMAHLAESGKLKLKDLKELEEL